MSEFQDPARALVTPLTEVQELVVQALAACITKAQTVEDEIAA
jgi:hypothetical protein